jgi:hypothetical protein
MTAAIPFNHPAGEAAMAKLRALPEPQRSRMQILVNRSLNPRDDKPIGFEPTERELAEAEQFAGAIVDMATQAGLSGKEGGAKRPLGGE